MTVGILAEPFPVSLPAVIKHIDVLCDAGLVLRTRTGRTVTCTLSPQPMGEALAWLERHARFWEAGLDRLEALVDGHQAKRGRLMMMIKNALVGVPVGNLEASVEWYTKLIGRAPDQRLMAEIAEYRFPTGGWLQIFEDKARAGQTSLTLVVGDLDAMLADLKASAIEHAPPTLTALVDTVIVNDPDGNQMVFAQSKAPANQATA